MTPDVARKVYASGEEKTVELLVSQAEEIARLNSEIATLLSGLHGTNRRFCEGCFEKQRKLDRLESEVKLVKQKLHVREKKAQEGYFGSSTPSSKKPVKANSGAGKVRKKPGAKTGHKGHGRKRFRRGEADRVILIEAGDVCRKCGGSLESRGEKERSVLDLPPIKPEKLLYVLAHKRCSSCGEYHDGRAPGVMPLWLYGNGLVAQTAAMHYVHGIPMAVIERQLGLPRCSLIDTFHALAKILAPVLPKLMAEYRNAHVMHADETPWRTQGQSSYAWIFHSETVTLFLFRHTRSGEIPREVFGAGRLAGTLVVDRYNGYSRVPCRVQFCYEHLKRNLQDLVKQYPDSGELRRFADHVVPLLRKAMRLRTRPISDERYYKEAAAIKHAIMAAMEADAQDEAIRTYQEIFRTNANKMYHWADDRRIPAHNNTAERELRPTVIARKVSFGSQSEQGRHTREVLASVLNTLTQRGLDPGATLKACLDRLALAPTLDPYPLLFEDAMANVEAASPENSPAPSIPPPSAAPSSKSVDQGSVPALLRPGTPIRSRTAVVLLLLFLLLSPVVSLMRPATAATRSRQLAPASADVAPARAGLTAVDINALRTGTETGQHVRPGDAHFSRPPPSLGCQPG